MTEHLSEYFSAISYKRLSSVEADPNVSHQHELNGIGDLRKILGDSHREFVANFIYLSDTLTETVTAHSSVTWYNARENHPSRTEFRLYYKPNDVTEAMTTGDVLVFAQTPEQETVIIVAQGNSTAENQIKILFNLPHEFSNTLVSQTINRSHDQSIDTTRSFILEQLGIESKNIDDDYLERLISTFPQGFPDTRKFSAYARTTLPEVTAHADPDMVITKWMEREELLFRTFEKYLLAAKIDEGFDSVEEFVSFSLGVQNRRKSRAGFALENHLEFLFQENTLRYSRGKETENKSKPDFVFPGITEYRDANYDATRLTMLGVKTSCKDRWRQVLSEAARIQTKHLFTLEPAISVNQTQEMCTQNVVLVLPKAIHGSYTTKQREQILHLEQFIQIVRKHQ